MVGAVVALVATGAAFWLGRERLREGIKGVRLPPMVLKMALWPSRYERTIAEGRQRCAAAVREALDAQLEPLAGGISDHIWAALRRALAESRYETTTVSR